MQFLKIFFKTDESAEIINLMLIYQIMSLFLNNESRLSIHDFFIIDDVLIVIYVQSLPYAFKLSLSLSYSTVLESFLNQWMAEIIACNNRLKRLITEGGGESCCVMVWVIIWAIMLTRVWGSMMKYIGREGADWSESRVMLRL